MFGMFHNFSVMSNAEKTINSFIRDPNCKIWITDSKGNTFVPDGEINVNYVEIMQTPDER